MSLTEYRKRKAQSIDSQSNDGNLDVASSSSQKKENNIDMKCDSVESDTVMSFSDIGKTEESLDVQDKGKIQFKIIFRIN